MKQKIINYLEQAYNAEAILLHGSRARGNAHEQSDWDILVFTKQTKQQNGGMLFEGQDLDIKIIKLPIANWEALINTYPQALQNTEILLDNSEEILKNLKRLTKEKYKKGPGTTEKEQKTIDNHFHRMLTRLTDFQDQPEIFFYHLSSFYIKTIKYWFEYQNRWSQPIVEALQIIEQEDKDFAKEMKMLINEKANPALKIKTAIKMITIIKNKKS